MPTLQKVIGQPAKFHGPPIPVHVPTNHDVPRSRPVEPVRETSAIKAAEDVPEHRMSQAEAEKALRDLVSDARNDAQQEIDMAEAIVPGFREGIRLLPHQVVGRKWMAERETGKRLGGILADDMG